VFLGGKDTASQNVLLSWRTGITESLWNNWCGSSGSRAGSDSEFLPEHSSAKTRDIKLRRAGTEAFDLAGDPAAFPEQVAGPPTPRTVLENCGVAAKEDLFFADADAKIFLAAKVGVFGEEISKSSKTVLANGARFVSSHQTQASRFSTSWRKWMKDNRKEPFRWGWSDAQHSCSGKSLVGAA